jgi:AcrR family transcriptional regulator
MEHAGPVSRRNRPAKPALSQETIVDAALTILDADGLDAVSMRRVAQALDTGAASLYVYVRNRDDLLALVLDRIVAEVPAPVPAKSADWRERLTTLISDTITVLGRHRGIATILFANVPTGPNALALTDSMLGLLAESGISRQARAWAVDLIALYVTAAGTEATIYQEKGTTSLKETEVISSIRRTFASLSPQTYPNIHDLREELVTGDGDDRTRWAIETLLNGILATRPVLP